MSTPQPERTRRVRADAQRSVDALVDAAREVFLEAGVDAPVRQIARRAGGGLATFYRHFPERSDLVSAGFPHEGDARADEGGVLPPTPGPLEGPARWLAPVTRVVGNQN